MYRWLVLAVLLSGCASAFPKEVMSTVNTAVTVEMLRPDPVAFKGQRVMVGGDILSTQPRTDETEIELLARRLGSDGAPDRGDQSPGRLLLRSPAFLDPAVYGQGRRVTVIGTVSGRIYDRAAPKRRACASRCASARASWTQSSAPTT